MSGQHESRGIRVLALVLILVLPVLSGCASLVESIEDGLPVTAGEMKEVRASMADTVEGVEEGNAWMVGAGGLGLLGVASLIARRMVKRAIDGYDAAPFVGPDGVEVSEAALVTAALGSPKAGQRSKS